MDNNPNLEAVESKEPTTEKSWAQEEIERAIASEKAASENEEEWKYGVGCYESALRAYECLEQDGHSGMSMQITKSILNRLVDHKVLTPIEDTEDIWTLVFPPEDNDGKAGYQCNRMSSLFKYTKEDGATRYTDNNRVICYNKGYSFGYHDGFITNVINEMFPIVFPYLPTVKPFRVYAEDFLYQEGNGDFDTRAIYYILKPDGERIDVNRFFKESEQDDPTWIEIDEAEYMDRKEHQCSIEHKNEQEDETNDEA